MIKQWRSLSKVIGRVLIPFALAFLVTSAPAFEIPGLGSIKIPSFKYGSLNRSRDVTRIFETYQVLPDHKYYLSGWGEVPYAIIGIRKQYKLRVGKAMWREVDATVPLMRSWVFQMDNVYGYPPYGSQILDDKGNPVGIWYSSKQWTTIIIEEENQIAILAPESPGFRGSR